MTRALVARSVLRYRSLPDHATGRCEACNRPVFSGSRYCHNRRCDRYSRIWAGDQREKMFRNLESFGGRVRLGAVTAPGTDLLPWDKTACSHSSAERCSGTRGCRVGMVAARRFNDRAPRAWRELHRWAYTKTVRRFGAGSLHVVARVWERQKRGVLHVHPVLAYETPTQRAAADYYCSLISERASAFGFGHSERKRVVMEGQRAAAYLSSYFVTGKKTKESLSEAVKSDDLPRSIIHVSVRLTQVTGVTMRSLRVRRHTWMIEALEPLAEVGRPSAADIERLGDALGRLTVRL